MIDQFTIARTTKLLSEFKQKHGRDIAMSELIAQGFQERLIDELVRGGILTKYQVVGKGGRRENRFKLATDWRSLKT